MVKAKKSELGLLDAINPKGNIASTATAARLDIIQADSVLTNITTMATEVDKNAITDWPDRYNHIDQVLNAPGPRTEEGFAAGDIVRVTRSGVVSVPLMILCRSRIFSEMKSRFL